MKKLITLLMLGCYSLPTFANNSTQNDSLKSFLQAPESWSVESTTIPFDFAPDMPLSGVEEQIFSPGMYEPEQDDYYSYTFSWSIEQELGAAPISLEAMQGLLHQYFDGLFYAAVTASEAELTEEALLEELSAEEELPPIDSQLAITMEQTQQGSWQYAGTIFWLEPFLTRAPQTLNFKARVHTCASNLEQRWYFVVSPQTSGHAIWEQLDNITPASC